MVDFVSKIPVLGLLILECGMFPPLSVFNEFLLKGEMDAGMSGSCQWQQIQVNEMEYRSLVADLEKNLGKKLVDNDKLRHVSTFEKWYSGALSVYSNSKR